MTPQEYCQKLPMTNGCKEPADTATVNYGTYFPNEPSDPYVGTFDGTSQSVVISGSEGYESPEPFKEPVETATVNYGTSLQNEPFNTYAGTVDGTSKGVGVYGSEEYESPGPFG